LNLVINTLGLLCYNEGVNLQIYTSKISDGSMKIIDDKNRLEVMENRNKFLAKNFIDPSHTVLVKITYETDDFCKYKVVGINDRGDGFTKPSTITADALCTNDYQTALFLPIADCIGAVLYSLKHHAFMVSHLGRHSLEQNGGFNSVKYFVSAFNLNPSEIKVWMSPAVGKDSYPLHKFEGKSLHEVAQEQFERAGIQPNHIEHEGIDVAKHKDYYSHSSFLKGMQIDDGRFAIVATMLKK